MANSKTAAGKKRITINDIAQMAGTSKTTVSFFLNGKTDRMSEETQKRIRLAIDETGYQPSPLARGMNAKQSTHGKLSGIDGTDIQILQISAQIDGIAFFHLIHKNFFSEIYTVRKRFQPVIFTAV